MYKARTDCHCSSIYYGVLLVVWDCQKWFASCFTNKAKTPVEGFRNLKRAKPPVERFTRVLPHYGY